MANPKIEVEIGAKINQFLSDLTEAEGALQKFGTSALKIGSVLTAAVTLPLTALGVSAVRTFGEIEALQKGLIAVMGSAEAAKVEFTKLVEVAKLPGLGLEEAARGSVALQSAGFSADKAREALLSFGNALATVGKGKNELNFVILALTQLQNKSSGFGQDLRQLTEQLPQLRGALQNAFGTSVSEDIAKLGFTGEEVVNKIITEFNKLPAVTGGIKNAFENFGDSVKLAETELGKAIATTLKLEERLSGLSDFLSKLAKGFSELDSSTQTAIIVFAGLAAAIGPVLLGIGTFIKVLPVLITGLGALKTAIIAATGPFGLIAIAVAAAIPLLFELNTELNRTKNIKAEVAQDLLGKKIAETNTFLGDQVKRYRELLPQLTEEQRIKKVLKFELEALKKVTGQSTASLKAQRDAILDWGLTALDAAKKADELANASGGIADGLGLIGGLTEKINLLNEARNLAKDQEEINLIDSKISKLEKQLVLIDAISKRANQEALPQVGTIKPLGLPSTDIVLPEGIQGINPIKIPPIDDESKNAFLLSLEDFANNVSGILESGIENTIGDFAFAIGDALANGGNVLKAAGSALLGGIAAILNQLGQLAIATGVAIGGIKKALLTLNPAVAIGAGVALVALAGFVSSKAKSLGGGGSSGGGGGAGGGSVGAGVSSQTFGGSGFSSNAMNLNGEFTVRGTDLVYVLNRVQDKNAKG
jgi:tape measure domain-containing protein